MTIQLINFSIKIEDVIFRHSPYQKLGVIV